jgi:hypothetical protein
MKQCIILLCYRGCCDETGCQVHNGYNELTYALFSRASEQRLSPNLCVSAESCERLRMVWDTRKPVGEITIPDLCEVWNWEGDTGVLADKWATTVQAAFLEGMTQSCTISWAEQRWVGCVSPAWRLVSLATRRTTDSRAPWKFDAHFCRVYGTIRIETTV